MLTWCMFISPLGLGFQFCSIPVWCMVTLVSLPGMDLLGEWGCGAGRGRCAPLLALAKGSAKKVAISFSHWLFSIWKVNIQSPLPNYAPEPFRGQCFAHSTEHCCAYLQIINMTMDRWAPPSPTRSGWIHPCSLRTLVCSYSNTWLIKVALTENSLELIELSSKNKLSLFQIFKLLLPSSGTEV